MEILRKFLSKARPVPLVRRDVVRFPVQENAYLEVYWKSVELGIGPTVLLAVHGREVMRFDCFGPGGHFHIDFHRHRPRLIREHRLFMPEKSVQEQIERALYEIRYNAHYYLQRNTDRSVQVFALDTAALSTAVDAARNKMFEYAKKVAGS